MECANVPYNSGITAPPAIPITKIPDAALVNLPTPLSAKGQIAGQTNEFARPKSPTNVRETIPSVATIPIVRTIPIIEQTFKAASCEKYLGIATIPTI